jgi:hypothetical protein
MPAMRRRPEQSQRMVPSELRSSLKPAMLGKRRMANHLYAFGLGSGLVDTDGISKPT